MKKNTPALPTSLFCDGTLISNDRGEPVAVLNGLDAANGVGAEIAKRWNAYTEFVEFVESAQDGVLCSCETCFGTCDGVKLQNAAAGLLTRIGAEKGGEP